MPETLVPVGREAINQVHSSIYNILFPTPLFMKMSPKIKIFTCH
jgi:hypothetical protein